MNYSIHLTTKNFNEASSIVGNNEFRFIIGENEVYCHKFIAAFLSHSVAQMLISDPTINYFYIETNLNLKKEFNNEKEQLINNQIQEILKNLIHGNEIEITEEELEKFRSELINLTQSSKPIEITDLSSTKISSLLLLTEILNNNEIREQIYSRFFQFTSSNDKKTSKKEELEQKIKQIQSIENLVKFLQNFQKRENNKESIAIFLQNNLNQGYKDLIDEIASNFFEFDDELFIKINQNILKDILTSQKLKIKSEDSLLEILLHRRSNILSEKPNENENEFFLEFVQFEFLSEKGIKEFVETIEFEDLTVSLWERIKKRLVKPIANDIDNDRMTNNYKSFQYQSNNPFNGIFKYLTDITKGNIQTNKTIEITSSCKCCGQYEKIIDFNDTTGYFHVGGDPSPRWVQFDLKDKKIQLDSYLIKSKHKYEPRFLRSWKIEISQDGKQWKQIDERNDVSELNGEDKMQVFKIGVKHEPFKYFRIITDKDNWCNSDGFFIGRIEIFGKLIQ